MVKNNKHYDDVWYQLVKDIIRTNIQLSTFIGHCCELKLVIEDCAVEKDNTNTTDNRDGLLYDGYLHLPELEILIPPDMVKSVDIHGLGKENINDVHSLLHGVVDNVNASQFFKFNLIPDASKCNKLSTEIKVIEYTDLFGNAKSI